MTLYASRSTPALPVIGILTRQDGSATWEGYRPYGQGRAYCLSVALAGGAPVLIPLELGEHVWYSIYRRLSGLLFPGGVDVHPSHYGESPHPKLGRVDEELDKAELMLARWALEDGLPTLAICRGIQLINVAAGGSLYQDLPAQFPGTLRHAYPAPEFPRDHLAHPVYVEPGTQLAAALGTGEHEANSRHHQAVKDLAPGFVITARAPDGVIEGIEQEDAPFVVGVQWHPESLTASDARMLALFQAFVRASA
jgi:putative glutamine amidotransferase